MIDQLTPLRERYLSTQLAGDRQEALRLLVEDGLLQGIAASSLYLEVIQPAQYEIGRLWQENTISIAQEHIATAISQLALSQLYRYLPRDPPNGRRVLVSCVEGELHEVGARMASDLLEMAGFDVRFLGANVPARALAEQVRRTQPELVTLSVTMRDHVPALQGAVEAVKEVAPRLPIAAGGLAFMPQERVLMQPGILFCGRDARELVAAAVALLET